MSRFKAEICQNKTAYLCSACFEYVNVYPTISLEMESSVADVLGFETYPAHHLLRYDKICLRCPCCGHEMFQCDIEIVGSISRLNKLEYYTRYCCAGHDKPNPYVTFDAALEEGEIEDVLGAFNCVRAKNPKFNVFETVILKDPTTARGDEELKSLHIQLIPEYKGNRGLGKTEITQMNKLFVRLLEELIHDLAVIKYNKDDVVREEN